MDHLLFLRGPNELLLSVPSDLPLGEMELAGLFTDEPPWAEPSSGTPKDRNAWLTFRGSAALCINKMTSANRKHIEISRRFPADWLVTRVLLRRCPSAENHRSDLSLTMCLISLYGSLRMVY